MGLSVAGGEVGLGLGGGTLGTDAIAHAMVSTLRLLPALLITTLVCALVSTTGTLAGTIGKDSIITNELAQRLRMDVSCKSTSISTCTLY